MRRPPISLGQILHALAVGVACGAVTAGFTAVLSYDGEIAKAGAVFVFGGLAAIWVLLLLGDWL